MSHTLVQIEGINVSATSSGDIKVILHLEDLHKSLSPLTTLRNGTHVLIATKRATPSAKGHTHNKATVKVFSGPPPVEQK